MYTQEKVKGKEDCAHQYVKAHKKIVTTTMIRCTKCGREEVHEEVQEKD